MPPEPGSARLARAWLQRARGNLARAKQPRPAEGFWEDLCFDAQQAAEKAVKSVLVLFAVDFPRTHQIVELLLLLRQAGHEAPPDVWRAHGLSEYAVVSRYPVSEEPVDPVRPVGEEEYRRAVELAESVVRWAEGVVRGV
ncbi:MAG: HEPN domain-containing protein [Candidatus Rokuibacteriota bacterium]